MRPIRVGRYPGMRPIAAVAAGLLGAAASQTGAQSTEPAVFVLNNVSDEVTSYTMNADGTLNFVGHFPASDGPQAGSITPDGRFLCVVHGTSSVVEEVVQIFQVNPDATLSLVLQDMVPNSPLAAKWLTDDVIAITETSLSSTNYIRTYAFDPGVPSFTEVDAGSTGAFTTEVIRHPSLNIVYAQDSTYNTISWFQFDAAGNLSNGSQISTSNVYPLRLATTHSGEFLYAAGGISNGGHSISGLRADAFGALTFLLGSPFTSPGDSPAYPATSIDDAFLFMGHGGDATVHSFAIDAEDGSLTHTGYSFDVGLQGTVGDVETLRGYLLVTDESTAIDGIKGIYSFAIQPDGNFIAVAPIYDPGGVRPEAIVAWDPGTGIEGDVNGDGVVDVLDLLAVLSAWGPCAGCPEDINGDGSVDVLDLLSVLANWT